MDDLINKLTNNGKNGTNEVLLLLLSDCSTSLYYLDQLNITGKKIETLVSKCIPQYTLEYITQTIRFLRSGFLGIDEIHNNLENKKPVHFITRLVRENEDWDYAYEEFAGDFRSRLSKNKSR